MRAVTLAGVVLLAGCGGGTGGSTGTYSCAEGVPDGDGGVSMPTACLEVSGGTAQDLANNQANCAASHWTFELAPCPRTGALGGCRETIPAGAITTWFYPGGGFTLSEIQMNCQDAANAGIPSQFVSP
jgi:hypothetical protein